MLGVVVVSAVVGTWGVLCLLFWQGSWQLLYHPESAVVRTRTSVGLQFESVSFDTDEAGVARLEGVVDWGK